jgi:uncharacterized membrane protein
MGNAILRLFSTQVYAQESPPPTLDSLLDFLTGDDSIINNIHPIGVVIAAGMIILGGYMWMTSGGDAGRKQQAQAVLTWAIAGLVFLFIVKGLITLLGELLLT